jgi:hypothetical protein
LRQVEVLTLEEEAPCTYCCLDFGPDQIALRWNGLLFCTHDCLGEYASQIPGKDYVASQDQALAAAADVLAQRPDNFILMYDSQGCVTSVILAQPEFVYACLPALAQSAHFQNDVAPPD